MGVPSFSGGASTQKIDSTYKSVQEQAGIYAGTGGFDITVGGNTDLKGAVIDSKADADKNKLSTDTITYSDIKNEAEWSAETKGVNYQKGDGVANKDKGLTPNFSGSKGEDDSTTKSAIAPGEIEIRSDEGKEEKDKTDLTDLSRDPDKANNPLDKIFDKNKILEKQQAAALFGEMAFEVAGKLAKEFGWEKGDPRRAALHGLIGGIMAEINGGKFGEGLTTAAINKILIDQLQKSGLTNGAELRWISGILGVALDGGQGGSIADSATKNNALVTTDYVKTVHTTTDDEIIDAVVASFDGEDFVPGESMEFIVKEKVDELVRAKAEGIYTEEEWDKAVSEMTPEAREKMILGSTSVLLATGGGLYI